MRSAKEQTKNRVAIAGQVRNDKTKLAIPGVLVEISQIEGKFKNWLDLHALQYGKSWEKMVKRPDRTLTVVDGCFSFINLPDGEYTLRIYKVNAATHIFSNENEIFCTKISDNKISEKDAHRWEDIFINVDIIPTIKGRIKDGTNNPVKDAEVKILVDDLQSTRSDTNGDYQLKYLEDYNVKTSLTIQVCAIGYKSVSRSVKLSQSEILELQNFKLTPEDKPKVEQTS